jgi:DNA polymerase V
VFELRGEPCLAKETVTPDRKNVCVSRSFNNTITSIAPLREAVVTFASQAGVKLRRQDLAARSLVVFIQTDCHAPPHVEQYGNSAGLRFTVVSL